MRTILIILQKEFLQIGRNKMILPLLLIMPFIQLIILGYAADFEVKNLNLHIIDNDQSNLSRSLVSKFSASPYFRIVNSSFSHKQGMKDIKSGDVDLILEIPSKFESKLINNREVSPVHLSIDAVNGVKAGLANAYASLIIRDFNIKTIAKSTGKAVMLPIGITWANWFNPDMNYSTFMVPGILVLLVTMVGIFLAAIIIVREKEIGTIEQLNVTPIKKYQFILGKLIPFFIIGFIELSLGLLVAKFIFNIHFEGNIFLVYAFTLVYLPAVLGIGLFISTISDTQQQAMFISWFFFVIFILMSGLFTPIENMPPWAQKITIFNPIKYFIEFMRMVLLKGSVFKDVINYFITMGIFVVVANSMAIWNYKKTSE